MHPRRVSGSTYALLGSVAAHGALAYWLSAQPRAEPRTRAVRDVLEFELSVLAPAPSAREVTPSRDMAERAREHDRPARNAHGEARAPVPEPTSAAKAPEPPLLRTADEGERASAAPAEHRQERAQAPDVSPLAAALTLREEFALPSTCEAALGHRAEGCAAGPRDAGANEAQAFMSKGSPTHAAMLDFPLERQPDGSYMFEGPSFRATITSEGRVRFEDKIVDLNTFVERVVVHMQINTAEKRRFMETTAQLREQLADEAERGYQTRALVTLDRALHKLLADPKLSLVQKREHIFALWDDCASDARGSEAQAVIENFVRLNLPQGSALAYGTAELTRLNRRRVGRRVFDPYANTDAGARPG